MRRLLVALTEPRFTALGFAGSFVAGNILGVFATAPWWAGFPVGIGAVLVFKGTRLLMDRWLRNHPANGHA